MTFGNVESDDRHAALHDGMAVGGDTLRSPRAAMVVDPDA
jgi:hypothetical protein